MMSLSLMLYPLVGFPTSAFAAPPEGKGQGQENGQGNGNGNGNQGNHGNSDHAKTERGQSRADVVSRSAERAHSKQAGGKDFYSKRAGDYGQRELPIQASDTAINSFSKRSDATKGHEASLLRDQNRRIIEDFEKVIGKLREHKEHSKGKDNARWNSNPKDDRGQGNMGKVDMLDPYGHSKDDRMDLYGNRGRVIQEIEELLTFLYTNYLFFDWITFYAIYQSWFYGLNLETLGFTAEEITFLRGLTGAEQQLAFSLGYVAMDPVEMTLLPISELDLGQLINYAAPTDTATDGSFQYSLSLTNPYDTPLTLTVSTAIQYTPGGVRGDELSGYVYVTNPYYFENYTLTSYSLTGDSTQQWETVTIQPGETIVLNDTYTASGQNYSGCGFNYGTTCHTGNGYTFGVTLSDSSTGSTYYDPAAGWFNASETIYGYGYDGYTMTYRR